MSFVVSCQCGKQFRVKDDQAGKKAKCPGCGSSLLLQPPPPPPPAAEESDPFANFDLEAAAAMERNAVVDENQGPLLTAPPPIPPPSAGGRAAPLAYARPPVKRVALPGDSDMGVGEWLLCIFCGGIACIVGIVYLVQGKPKGGKMIGFGILFNLLWGIVQFGLEQFLRGR